MLDLLNLLPMVFAAKVRERLLMLKSVHDCSGLVDGQSLYEEAMTLKGDEIDMISVARPDRSFTPCRDSSVTRGSIVG
jgi:hypothetical protein